MENKKNYKNYLLSAGRIYLWLMLLGLPLVIWDGYFDITEVKTAWFAAGSLLYLLARGVLALQYGACWRRLRAGEICALAFGLVTLFSTALSGRLAESFLGPAGRWQGAGMMLLYAGLYLTLSDTPLRTKDVLLPLAAGLVPAALLAAVNHLGWDVLGLSAELAELDRGRYISTLGNINFAGAYLALALPVCLYRLLTEESRGRRGVWGAVCLLGLWAAMAVRSESTILGLAAALLTLPFLLRSCPSALRRWGLLWPGLGLGMQLYRLAALGRGAYLSALTRGLLHPAVTALFVLGGAGVWLWLRRREVPALRRWVRVYGYVLAGGLVLAAVLLALLNTVWSRVPLGSLESWLRFSEGWGTDRGKVWAYCWALYRGFPWLDKLLGGGCGVLAALDAVRRIFPDAVLDAAHCEYLQILLNWGALGLLLYLGWLGFTAREVLRRGDGLSLGLLSGLIGYAAQAAVNIAQTPGIALFFVLLSLAHRREELERVDLSGTGKYNKNNRKSDRKGA